MKIKLSIVLLLLIIYPLTVFSSDRKVNYSDYPKDKEYFSMVGKSFKVKKDNSWLFKKWGVASTFSIAIFSKAPLFQSCIGSSCDRRALYSEANLKIDDIVYPVKENGEGKYRCETSALFCYFKVNFDNGDIAYLSVGDFITASSPLHAVALETPSLLQLIPLEPDSKWKYDKKYYDNHFKKKGIQQGFTEFEVLNSSWGRPSQKTKSVSGDNTIEIWSYTNGSMVGFINGYVERITTVE
jgi:hypothetical protein